KMMVYGGKTERVTVIPTERAVQNKFCLKDEQILQLAKWVEQIEHYYSKRKGRWTPMDVEWALDGISNRLFIVQARPETVHSRKAGNKLVQYHIQPAEKTATVLLRGIAV